jgi:hypothetical protein
VIKWDLTASPLCLFRVSTSECSSSREQNEKELFYECFSQAHCHLYLSYQTHSNNGHMIKFSFFNSDSSYQCHFDEIGTFVVSIAHYMRAYFNYQALQYGQQFYLPSDAGYLNCVQLKETENSDYTLYAKIGCQDRETFTSTKLALKVYTDAQCSEPFDDEKTTRYHSSKGYNVNGTLISSSVSFRPPFYNCNGCQPDQISDTFNLLKVSWYDDDYISQHGEKQEYEQEEDDDDEEEQNQQGNQQDDYFNDDFADDYFKANDDINNQNYYNKNNQNRYLAEEKSLVRSALHPRQAVAAEGQLEVCLVNASLDHYHILCTHSLTQHQ